MIKVIEGDWWVTQRVIRMLATKACWTSFILLGIDGFCAVFSGYFTGGAGSGHRSPFPAFAEPCIISSPMASYIWQHLRSYLLEFVLHWSIIPHAAPALTRRMLDKYSSQNCRNSKTATQILQLLGVALKLESFKVNLHPSVCDGSGFSLKMFGLFAEKYWRYTILHWPDQFEVDDGKWRNGREAVDDSGSCLNWSLWPDSGLSLWSWARRMQQNRSRREPLLDVQEAGGARTGPEHEILKITLLHRRLREQYHLEKQHWERWLNDDNGIPARQCWHCALRFTRSSKIRLRALAPKLSGIAYNIGGYIYYWSLYIYSS